MVEFRELNLTEPWGNLPRFDVVFFRNVLIYFEVEKKREILHRLVSAMKPDGYLLLGAAETTYGLSDCFARICMGQNRLLQNHECERCTAFALRLSIQDHRRFSRRRFRRSSADFKVLILRRQGLQILEHCRNEFGDRGVYVHSALNHRIGSLGIHHIQNAVNNFVAARA